MKRKLTFAALMFAILSLRANAQSAPTKAEEKSQPVTATFLVTGLHCPPCTRTVETSLRGVRGIKSISVDWKAKNAHIDYDESVIPAQQVARLIADTPHMMGRSLHYGGWLALKVDELKDDASGKPIKEALANIEGVKAVALYPKQHAVAVQFAAQGDVTDRELLDTLTRTGFHAVNL